MNANYNESFKELEVGSVFLTYSIVKNTYKIDMSRSSYDRAIKELKDIGFIAEYRRGYTLGKNVISSIYKLQIPSKQILSQKEDCKMHPLLKQNMTKNLIRDVRNEMPEFACDEEALLWLQNDSLFDLSRPEVVAERQKIINFYTKE